MKQAVALTFPSRKEPVIVETHACDMNVCVALLPVGPVMREQIAKAAIVHISYGAAPESIALEAPLRGLSTALAAIE